MAFRHQDFHGDMATMLKAGLSITKALGVSARNRRGRVRKALLAVAGGIEDGLTLSQAMRGASGLFPAIDISIIEAGERSGRLAESFASLAGWHLLKYRTWNAIRCGLALPFLEIHAAAFLMPLPAVILGQSTLFQYLMAVVSFLLVFVYVPFGVVLGLRQASGRQGRFRRFLDPILLKVPLLGPALRDLALARYCEGFGALYDAGVNTVRCAANATELCGNAAVAAMLAGGAVSAREGNAVSEGFSAELPFDFLESWRIGEQAGRLAETLQRLAGQRQEQAARNLREFGRWVPRVCMFLVILVLVHSLCSLAW